MRSALRAALFAPGAGLDPDAQRYIAMIPTPSRDWALRYHRLAVDLKTSGLWDKVPLIALAYNFHERAALVDFRNPARRFVNYGAAFSSSAGFLGDGVDDYIDLSADVAALGVTQDSIGLYAWINGGTDAANDGRYIVGTIAGITHQVHMRPRTAGGACVARLNGSGNSIIGTSGTVLGRHYATRRGSADTEYYRSGVSIASGSTASTGFSPGSNLCLLRYSSSYGPFQIGTAAITLGLTDAEAAAFDAAVTSYAA